MFVTELEAEPAGWVHGKEYLLCRPCDLSWIHRSHGERRKMTPKVIYNIHMCTWYICAHTHT